MRVNALFATVLLIGSTAAIGADFSLAGRIARVERGLLPPARVEGLPGWSIAERMQQYQVPGVSIAVISQGKLEWERSYGVLEMGKPAPVTPAPLFQAGSISKPVAALGALKLVDDGRLSLDEDVNTRLTAWKVPANQFTDSKTVSLRALLSHGAGMSVHGFPGYRVTAAAPALRNVLDGDGSANTQPIRVITEPGTHWEYSGGGYTVAQQLMMDVSNTAFPALMQELVLGPAGMTSSTFEQPLPGKWEHRAAAGHKAGKVVFGKWHVYPEMAAAGLWTTPGDLARLAVILQERLGGKDATILSRVNTQEMFRLQMGSYGLGFRLEGNGAAARFVHGGVNEGFDALFVAYSESGKGAVVMINANTGNNFPSEVMRAIAAEYGWEDNLPPARKVANVDPIIFGRYAGLYKTGSGIPIRFSREGDRLMLQAQGQQAFRAYPESERRYFTQEFAAQVEFLVDKQGKATGLVWSQGRRRFTYRRAGD